MEKQIFSLLFKIKVALEWLSMSTITDVTRLEIEFRVLDFTKHSYLLSSV